MANAYQWNCSVGELTGVGPARREALEKAGIRTLGDLVGCYPRAYQNRGDVRSLETIREITKTGEPLTCSAVLTVGTEPQVRRIRNNLTLVKFSAFDGSGSCEITTAANTSPHPRSSVERIRS